MILDDSFLLLKLKHPSTKTVEKKTFAHENSQHTFGRFIAAISMLIFLTEGRESEVKGEVLFLKSEFTQNYPMEPR